MTEITCCQFCKPPKRYPGCGDYCKIYKEQKEKRRQEQNLLAKQRNIERGLNLQAIDFVVRTRKKKWGK